MLLSLNASLRLFVPSLGCLSMLALAGCGGSSTSSPIGGGGVSGSGSGGSGSFTANFSAISGTNAFTSDFSSSNVGGSVTPPIGPIGSVLTLTAVAAASNNMGRSFTLVLTDTTLTEGQVYPLDNGSNSLVYADTPDAGSRDFKATRTWSSTDGSVTLDSINGKTYKFHVTGVLMGPSAGGPTSPGTGTFTVNGSGTASLS